MLNQKYLVIHYLVITQILLLTSQNLRSSDMIQCNRSSLDSQRLLIALQEREYDDAIILMQQTPATFQGLAPDTQVTIFKSMIDIAVPTTTTKNPTDEKKTAELNIATMLLKNKPDLCDHLPDEKLKQLCNHVINNPVQNANLFKALITAFFQTKKPRFNKPFYILVTNNQQSTDNTVYSLPTDLQTYLLEQQMHPRKNPWQYEINFGYSDKLSDYTYNRLLSNPAINMVQTNNQSCREQRHPQLMSNFEGHDLCFFHNGQIIHINKDIMAELPTKHPEILPILYHIIRYAHPEICVPLLKLALYNGANLKQLIHTQESIVDFAKCYNPSCILFLQQYTSWRPTYNAKIITRNNYEILVSAYNSFMLADDIQPLYALLKPDIVENELDGLTLQFRHCFTREIDDTYLFGKESYVELYNRKYLYVELLPMLQNIRKAANNINIVNNDSIFFDAIVHNKPEIVSAMCKEGYNPNTYYIDSVVPEHYGSLPLWSAVASGNNEITKILLYYGASPQLKPYYFQERSLAHFALHSCFYQDSCCSTIPKHNASYVKYIATLRTILEYSKQNINVPERSGQTLLEYAIRFEAQQITIDDLKPNDDAAQIPKHSNYLDIITMLLELGADPFQKSSEQLSLEKLAQGLGHLKLAQWLSQYTQNIHKNNAMQCKHN